MTCRDSNARMSTNNEVPTGLVCRRTVRIRMRTLSPGEVVTQNSFQNAIGEINYRGFPLSADSWVCSPVRGDTQRRACGTNGIGPIALNCHARVADTIEARKSVLDAAQMALIVDLIAVKRADFRWCKRSELLRAVVERYGGSYDYIPIIDGNTVECPIVSLLHLAGVKSNVDADAMVETYAIPLTEKYLIGANESIIKFMQHKHEHGFCLTVSGGRISGLVSISDLQRLPVQVAVFAMITVFEMTMGDTIRCLHNGSESWKTELKHTRRASLQKKIDAARSGSLFVDDDVMYTEFCDKRDIIWKRVRKQHPAFYRDAKQIESIRNALAHANNTVLGPKGVEQACNTISMIYFWLEELQTLCCKHQSPRRRAS